MSANPDDPGGSHVVSASPEVIEHHAREHLRRCPGPHTVYHVLCPCERSAAIVCGACHEPVFITPTPPDGRTCLHGRELLDIQDTGDLTRWHAWRSSGITVEAEDIVEYLTDLGRRRGWSS